MSRHRWNADARGSATCTRCGLYREVRRTMMRRPVFGRRVRKTTMYRLGKRSWHFFEMPPCPPPSPTDD